MAVSLSAAAAVRWSALRGAWGDSPPAPATPALASEETPLGACCSCMGQKDAASADTQGEGSQRSGPRTGQGALPTLF